MGATFGCGGGPGGASTTALAPETIRMLARHVPVPRLVAFHGEPGRRYRYSGRDHEARPWTPALLELVGRLRAATGTPYDTVLCNHYRDGDDAMGRHADDEPELGPTPDDLRIASVSPTSTRGGLPPQRSRASTLVRMLPWAAIAC